MFSRFKIALLALLFGIIPYFFLAGSVTRVTRNGVVVRDEQFNLFGIVLALVGLWFVFTVLRPSAPRDMAHKGLAVVAGLVCALQLAASIDIVRPRDWFNPTSDMPPLAYKSLSESNRNMAQAIVDRGDVGEITRNLVVRMSSTLGLAQLHMFYADICFEGRYRIDHEALKSLMTVLPRSEQEQILTDVEFSGRTPPKPEDCGPQRTAFAMGEVVDDIHQDRDMIEIIRDGYVALTQ